MNKVVSFLLGASCGSIVTYFLIKKKANEKADEEIESVVKTFKDRINKIEEVLTDEQKEKLGIHSPSKKLKEQLEQADENITNKDIKVYAKELDNLGYSTGVDLSDGKDQNVEYIAKQTDVKPYPYVISEEEYGEFGNDEVTLIYYADHILADEDDNVINDIDDLIGDCLTQFGDLDECIYVRNESKEIDYVILRSEKNFKDLSLNIDEVDQ